MLNINSVILFFLGVDGVGDGGIGKNLINSHGYWCILMV
jgi:hypothetical protein